MPLMSIDIHALDFKVIKNCASEYFNQVSEPVSIHQLQVPCIKPVLVNTMQLLTIF